MLYGGVTMRGRRHQVDIPAPARPLIEIVARALESDCPIGVELVTSKQRAIEELVIIIIIIMVIFMYLCS